MRKLAVVCLCLAFSCVVNSRLSAQQNNNYLYAIGNQPFSAQIPVENGFINVNNGDIHIEIPLTQSAQRGSLQLNERLVYDSRIWKIVSNSGYSWSPTNVPNSMAGWTFQSGETVGNVAENLGNVSTISCGPPPTVNYTETQSTYEWTDPTGTVHPFTGVWTAINSSNDIVCGTSMGTSQRVFGTALDASGYTILLLGNPNAAPTSITVYDRVGNEVYPTLQDPNGNFFSSDANGNLVDTLGRTPVKVSTSGNKITYSVLGFNGALESYIVTTETVNYHTSFGQSAVSEISGSFTAIQSIELPDTTTYSFTYDSGTAAGNYGELTSVTLPSGGVISYTYQNFLDSFQNQNRWLATRVKDSGTTKFAPATISNCSGSSGCQEKSTVTDPSGNDTVYTFTLDKGSYYNASSWNTGVDAWQGSSTSGGTKLKSQATAYTYAVNTYQPSSGFSEAFETPQTITTTTTLADVSLTSKTLTTLDSNGVNPVSVQFWDYYSGSAPSPTQTTTYAYNYSVNYANLLTQVTVQDGSGNQISQTTYGYDEATGPGHAALVATSGLTNHNAMTGNRGNLTTTQQWLNTSGGTLSTMAAYDDAGSLLTSTDPNGTTTYGHDNSDALTTSITPPTPSSGVILKSSSTYDFSTGLITSSTDPNGAETAYTGYDDFGRVGEVQVVSGGDVFAQTKAYYYTAQSSGYSSPTSIVYNYQNASQYGQAYTLYDTYRRTSRAATSNGQSGNDWYQQDSCYDTSGRSHFQSYRYQGTGFVQGKTCSGGGDVVVYDGLGRPKTVTHADGTVITYSYTGRATEVIDENNVSRISQVDGLGRVTSVCEISSASLQGVAPVSCGQDIAATGFLTSYTYSLANHTTTVTQGAQTRIFQTDSLGRTTSVTEPERGTTTYGYAYNSTGLVVIRQRPKANQTSASTVTTTTTQYDAVGRVASVSYNDSLTPNKSYYYDVNPSSSWTETLTNPKGRLVLALSGTGATLAETLFSYDPTGRVLTMWQCAPSICGTANQAGRPALSFSYDWTGNLTGEFDGASGLIAYARSPAGEVTSITNESYQGAGNPADLVSNILNGPDGPTSYTLGNGLAANFTYDALGRRNGLWLCSGSTSPACTGGNQIYGSDLTTKGSQVNQEIDTVLNQQITYGYDQFNRLASRNVYSGTAQNFTYSYDRYGNRWAQALTAGSGPQLSLAFSATTNQITTAGYTYDAAGNMSNDSFHSYTYDAEGNILTVDGGSNGSYVYDALNRRVRVQTSASTYEYLYDYADRRISSWLLNVQGYPAGFGNEGRIYWDGQQIAYRAWDGTTYFEQQDYLGTERMRTNYTGAVAAAFFSLPWGDDSSATIGGTGPELDNAIFAGLDLDTNTSGAPMSDHAQFRNYSLYQGRWLAPDPYDGSYDATNPQSFNRYAYVANNPLTFTDPSGKDPCAAAEGITSLFGQPELGVPVCIGEAIAGLFKLGDALGWFKPKFHGTLAPRPGAGNPDWGDDPGSFGESLGIGSNVKTGSWGIAGALGLPDAGCDFGACGGGPMNAAPGQNGQAPAISVLPYATYQDILAMRGAFDAGIAALNSKGRLPLSGEAGGAANNIWQCARALAGRPMYGCGGQAAYMYGEMNNLQLNGNWTFNYIYRAFPPHQFVTATMPGGPSILIDPWKNIFEVNY